MNNEMFPEINYFIDNPKKYELLYFAGDYIHNEYALGVVEAKKIMNYISSLEKENQELEKQLEVGEQQYNELVEEKDEYINKLHKLMSKCNK